MARWLVARWLVARFPGGEMTSNLIFILSRTSVHFCLNNQNIYFNEADKLYISSIRCVSRSTVNVESGLLRLNYVSVQLNIQGPVYVEGA